MLEPKHMGKSKQVPAEVERRSQRPTKTMTGDKGTGRAKEVTGWAQSRCTFRKYGHAEHARMRCVGGEDVPVWCGALKENRMKAIGFLSMGLCGQTDLKTGLKG